VLEASKALPSLKGQRISPHTFRHSTAMHLLQSGVAPEVIALWLGHESPDTTHFYVEADLEMKRQTLELVSEPKTKRFRRGGARSLGECKARQAASQSIVDVVAERLRHLRLNTSTPLDQFACQEAPHVTLTLRRFASRLEPKPYRASEPKEHPCKHRKHHVRRGTCSDPNDRSEYYN
jgi:hypothetical protein